MNPLLFSILYLVVDIMWITFMSNRFYQPKIESIQGSPMRFKVLPAVLAYITLLITMFAICVPLSERYKTKTHPALVFALVGFCLYGVYNFTNGAIFERYDPVIMLVDTAWGTLSFAFFGFLFSSGAFSTFLHPRSSNRPRT